MMILFHAGCGETAGSESKALIPYKTVATDKTMAG